MVRCSAGGLAAAVAVALCCLVSPARVTAVSVNQACVEVSCFSGVVAACGSCFPTTSPTVSRTVLPAHPARTC